MISCIQSNIWWILPLIMYAIKILIEQFIGRFRKTDKELAIKRTGLEFCFLSLGFYGLALVDCKSKFYVELQQIQAISVCLSFVILLILYGAAVFIYKRYNNNIAVMPAKKLGCFLGYSLVGVLALVLSLNLF